MQESPELEAIIRRVLRARQTSEFDTVRNIFSESEHLVSVGSDVDEWWKGGIDIGDVITEDWEDFAVARDEVRRIESFENGNTGWVVMEAERTSAAGLVHLYRMTWVFVLEGGSWRVIHFHFSIPVSNEVLEGGDLTWTLADLLGSSEAIDDVEGARTRTATIVFTDIVDSTALSATMKDAAWSALLDQHFEMLDDIVRGEGGTVVKTLGDGGMFVFASAGAALRAAASIQRLATEDGRLPVRIGMHSGDVVTHEDDVVGLTVAKAARVASAAGPGTILVSATTVGMVNGHEFDFAPPKAAELKGISGTHHLHELRW